MAFLRAALAFLVLLVAFLVGSYFPSAALGGLSVSAKAPAELSTPNFVQVGKRYAFTWAGGGPSQTYTVREIRSDGWIVVNVAEETINPIFLVPGEFPTRWLNVGLATSIQEMRPIP